MMEKTEWEMEIDEVFPTPTLELRIEPRALPMS